MEKKTNPKYQKTSKSALVTSVLSLVLCFAMLIGTTLAWFTDSVTSGNNIIKSGTLDVTMEWKDATTTGAQQEYKDASKGAIFNNNLWEPGYVEAKNIKISNIGTLDFKYQLNIVATGEVSKLADVIDVYYAEDECTLNDRTMSELKYIGRLTDVLNGMSATANGDLLNGESDIVTIALKMQETAGNEYQGLSIGTDFSVQLVATQLTSETDSFDKQYDKMATIDTEDELGEALAADYDLIQLGANINLTDSVVIPADKTVAIDLAGYTMSQEKAQTDAYAMINNKGTLTIMDSVGTGKISYADTTIYSGDNNYASNTIKNEGTLNITGGTIENVSSDNVMKYGYPHAIDVYQGSTTNISGGTVKSANYDAIRMFCNSSTKATTVNISGGTIINRVSFQDPASNRAGFGVLTISGGTFITTDGIDANVRLLNFSNAESKNMKATVTGGIFDKGFKTQDIVNAGVKTSDWLTIGEEENTVAVTTTEELKNALTEGGDIVLAKDVIYEDTKLTIANDKEVTIDLNGNSLSGVNTQKGTSALIENKGTLDITGNGTITVLAENPDTDWNPEGFPTYASNTIANSGKLTIGEGVRIENQTAGGGASYAIDNYAGATLTVNGGEIIQSGGDVAIRMNTASATAENKVIINGGTIKGKRAIWIHLAGSQSTTAPSTTLEINGGELSGTQMCIYSYSYGNSFSNTKVTINGGTFNGDVQFGGGYKGDKETVSVTGGTFNGNLGRWLENNGWEDIQKPE